MLFYTFYTFCGSLGHGGLNEFVVYGELNPLLFHQFANG